MPTPAALDGARRAVREDLTTAPLRTLRVAGVVLVLAGLVPLANLLSGGQEVPWWNRAVLEWVVRGTMVLVLAAAVAAVAGARVERAAERAARLMLAPAPAVFAATISLLALAGAALLARYCFAGQPFTSDEMAQQWHARILLDGHLSLAAEAHREFFDTAPVVDANGRWFSQYPVGGPALIALGLAVRAAWLVNPIFLVVAVCSFYGFARRAFDELTARTAALLFLASPMVLIMSASQMSHVPALAFGMLALAMLPRWERATDARRAAGPAAVIGLAVGALATVRPYDALLVALTIAGFQIAAGWRRRELRLSLAWQLAAGALPVALLLWANAQTTGQPLLFAYDVLNGPGHSVGFHLDPNGDLHTPLRGLIYVSGYLMRLNRYLFEWPLPALALVAATLLALRHASRWDVLLVALIGAFLAGYGAYWFDGFFAGPRFLFGAVPAFVLFAARAPQALRARVQSARVRHVLLLLIPICVAAAWLLPAGVSGARPRVAGYHEQRSKLKTDIGDQVARAGLHNALVFVNESWRGRLLARLRVLGVEPFQAERLASTYDACALQTALDAEDTLTATSVSERRVRVMAAASAAGRAEPVSWLPADQRISLVPGRSPAPACVREGNADRAGVMPYALFLAQQRVADGRVAGDVIFVRDLGPRDSLLATRFSGRVWYRYRTPSSLDDSAPAFVPYSPMYARTRGSILSGVQ